jgi:hypothetical protein
MALLEKYLRKNSKYNEINTSQLKDQLSKFQVVMLKQVLTMNTPELPIETSFIDIKRNKVEVLKNPEKYDAWFDDLIPGEEENLSEVINQLATVERIIGALNFREFENLRLEVAHLNQSSDDSTFNHDLVLHSPTNENEKIMIEVSDVVSTKDSNKKFEKDLNSLYETYKDHKTYRYFLIMSKELYLSHWKDENLRIWLNVKKDALLVRRTEPKKGESILSVLFEPKYIDIKTDTHVLEIKFN